MSTGDGEQLVQSSLEMPAQGRARRRHLGESGWAVLGLFVLLATAFTWPLVTHMGDTLPDWGDTADSTWRLGSISRQLATDPLHLYSSNTFYPMRSSLELDELLTGQALLAAPVVWLTGNPVLAFNLLNFLSYVLSGFAMWLLVRYLTSSSLAGVAAGVVFAFSPWHYGQYGHLGLGAQFWMVFALYFLVRFLDATRERAWPLSRRAALYLALMALFFVAQALVAGYYAYFEAILLGIYVLYHVLFASGILTRIRRKPAPQSLHTSYFIPHTSRQLLWLALAGVAALAVLAPFVLPFVQAKGVAGFNRSLEEVSYWSAGPRSLLRTTVYSPLYQPVQVRLLDVETSVERELYPGVAATLLAVVGLVGAARSGRGRRAWLFALVAGVGLLLSFGPYFNWDGYGEGATGIPLPYKWLYEHVPGFDALRVPHRFGLLFMLGIAVCAGYGVAWPARWAAGRGGAMRWLPAGALLLVAAEFFGTGLPAVHTGTGSAAPPLYGWLSSDEGRAAVPPDALLLELPIGGGEQPINTNPIYSVYSLQHGRPVLNGSSNIVPPGYDRLFFEMRRFPTPETLDIVEALGVRYLLVHTAALPSDEKRAALVAEAEPGGRLEQVATFPDFAGRAGYVDVVLRVKPNPARLQRMATAIPPGSTVLLTDQQAINRRLYSAALPYFLGPDKTYYQTYSTIYDGLPGKVQPAKQGQQYDFAIIYKNDDPARWGYSPEKKVDTGENELVELYRR